MALPWSPQTVVPAVDGEPYFDSERSDNVTRSAPLQSTPEPDDGEDSRETQSEEQDGARTMQWTYMTPSIQDLSRHYLPGVSANGKAKNGPPTMVTFDELPPLGNIRAMYANMTPSIEDLTKCYLHGGYCDGSTRRRAAATVASMESIGELHSDSYHSEQDDTSAPTASAAAMEDLMCHYNSQKSSKGPRNIHTDMTPSVENLTWYYVHDKYSVGVIREKAAKGSQPGRSSSTPP